jgi:hypothetical protein
MCHLALGISIVAFSPILSTSSKDITKINPHQLAPTVGIAMTGFCHPDGILQLFCRQDQQISRLPTAAAAKLLQLKSRRNRVLTVREQPREIQEGKSQSLELTRKNI